MRGRGEGPGCAAPGTSLSLDLLPEIALITPVKHVSFFAHLLVHTGPKYLGHGLNCLEGCDCKIVVLLILAKYSLEAIFLVCCFLLMFDGLDHHFLTLAAPTSCNSSVYAYYMPASCSHKQKGTNGLIKPDPNSRKSTTHWVNSSK